MPTQVQDQWYIKADIAGKPLDLNPTVMPKFEIINSIHQHLPSLTMMFKDGSGKLAELFQYGDGTKINVSVGVSGIHIYENLKFVMQGRPQGNPTDSSIGLSIKAVGDNIKWSRKVVDEPTKGTSSDVFKKWAEKAGLKVDADPTNDSQVWLPNRTPIAEYVKHIAERAWVGEKSAMVLGITDSGVAKYKDIDKLIQGSPTIDFVMTKNTKANNPIPVLHYVVASKSHVTNASRGYGATTMSTDMTGKSVELNKVDVRQLIASVLPMSTEVKDIVGDLGTRIMQLPRLAGNTHDKWNDAIHNNKRIKATYGLDIHILCDVPSRANLLDLVHFTPINQATKEPISELTGKYMVTAITRFIHGKSFYEKICLTSQ